jgi:2-polyprenyl-3-methyl-5-hydroxy-6-metoxy-1,4-benzoquinol methylase
MKHAEQVRNRYVGKTAAEYDAKRMSETRWPREQHAVRKYLGVLKPAPAVLDIPAGTGRYAQIYAELGAKVTATDTSGDMLALAREAFKRHSVPHSLVVGDILKLEPPEVKYDVAVCTRMLNHFTRREAKLAVSNLLACANAVILSVREPLPGHSDPNWHPLEQLTRASSDITVISERADSRYIMALVRYES